jgi:hypothetical protein
MDVFLYIYKYLFKGPDHATFSLSTSDSETDAVDDYIHSHYISSCEAAWQFFLYHISHQFPSVMCLAVHEQGLKHHQFCHIRASTTGSDASSLIQYFNHPSDPMFDNMLYTTFCEHFVLAPYPLLGSPMPLEWWPEAVILPNVPPHIVK